MPRRKVDLASVFLPSDSFAFVVILIGLFIALFLDEMAVRLIGVCIAVLGGVALFMMVSPRLTDLSLPRPPRPTESPLFMSQTMRDGRQTRQVFDSLAYRATFGAEENNGSEAVDERQIELFPGLMEARDKLDEQPQAQRIPSGRDLVDMEFADGQSSVRVVGVRSSRATAPAPPLAISNRGVRRAPSITADVDASIEAEPEPPTHSPDLVIKGPVTEEVQLSDDVVIRPRGSSTSAERTPAVSVTDKPPIRPEPLAPAQTSQPHKRDEIRVSTFMEDDEEEMEISEEPRKEFDYLLNRVLMVIRSATSARTAAFFWVNRERGQLVLEARISDAKDQFTDQRKLSLGQDVVSQIATEGRPEIISEISPFAELDLLPYYKQPAGTKSFVGVPVYFQGSVVGVLCADSAEDHAYTDVTVGFFGHFTKLISGLVLSYTSKFDLQQNTRLLDAVMQFRSKVVESEPTTGAVISALFDTVVKLMDVSTVGVCAYDKARRMWTLSDARSVIPEYAGLIGTALDLENSLVGECLRNGEPIAISVEGSGVRVTANEPEVDLVQFVAVPMRSLLHTHGALYLENHRGTITSHDVTVAELLADLAGEMIAGLREQEREIAAPATVVAASALPAQGDDSGGSDVETFHERLKQELARATDYQSVLTVCFVGVDPLKGLQSSEEDAAIDAVVALIEKRVHEQIREYDLVARVANDTLAIALMAYTSQEAQFWTENLRRDIASSSVNVGSKRVMATISVGVASFEASDTWQSLLEHAETALTMASRQQNKVIVYG